jgi:hypothetical protein
MPIQTRHLAFVYSLWDNVQDKIVGLADEQGNATYFPYWNATQTALTDPSGQPVISGAVAYDQAISRSNHVGVTNLTVVTKTASFTPTILEAAVNSGDNLFLVNSGSAVTCTLPQNSAVAFPVNTKLNLLKVGAGDLIVAAGTGATVISAEPLTTSTLNSRFECWKIGPNLWHVFRGPVGAATGTAPTPAPSAQFTTAPVITASATPIIPGVVLTCTDGTTNVTTTKVKNWWFLDTVNGFTGPIIAAGAPVTGNTYTLTDQDIDNTVFVKLDATPAFGAVLSVEVPGFTVTRPATTPPPSPPPSPGTTRGLTVSEASLVASGPITVSTSNQTIQGFAFTGGANLVTVSPGVTGTTIQNCSFQSNTHSGVFVQGGNTVIRNCLFKDMYRGIIINSGTNTTIQYNRFEGTSVNATIESHSIENDFNTGPTLIDSNDFRGENKSDTVSNFNTSRVTMTNNSWQVLINEPSSAAFTMGDSLNFQPGRDNYIAGNTIIQTGGGVPPGVFGSEGNTVMEYNCFTNGIQCYNYEGNPLLGVTIRFNVIAPGYFVPDTSVIAGWNTNIIGTDCNQVPTP